jgi:hypothetical protein
LVEETFGEVTCIFWSAGGQNEKARVSHLSSPSL